MVSKEASEKNYSFSVLIFSYTREELHRALDHMIRCGYEEIEAGDKRFWLYAVKHSFQHKALFQAELKYIFRVRQIPEEILDPVEYEALLNELLQLKLQSDIKVRVTCGPQFARVCRREKLERMSGSQRGTVSLSPLLSCSPTHQMQPS